MADRKLEDALRQPGRFALAPTDLTVGYPHGGTKVGYTRETYIGYFRVNIPIPAEEWGATAEVLQAGEQPRIVSILRQADPDVLALFFNVAVGGTSGRNIYSPKRAGYLITSSVLVFSPDDTSSDGVLFRRALPQLEQAGKIALALNLDVEWPIVFDCGWTDSSTKPYEVGPLKDIVLP